MVYVRMMGGLGNQLFQFAAGYALSRREKQELRLDTSFFDSKNKRQFKLNDFCISDSIEIINKTPNNRNKFLQNRYVNKTLRILEVENPYIFNNQIYILEGKFVVLDSYFAEGAKSYYLDGYFQAPRYFNSFRDDIVKQLTLKPYILNSIKSYIEDVNSVESVAVHVRRGDFLKAKNDYTGFHYLLDSTYYNCAFDYVQKHILKPVFYCFSDDIEWVKKEIVGDYDIRFINIQGDKADLKEFEIMRNCKHIITANSTFSWWASWLNLNSEAIHIVPQRQYGNNEMIPNEWIKL